MATLKSNPSRGTTQLLALLLILSCAAVGFLAKPAQSEANSVNFCYLVTLQPYGHSGDRCFGPGSYIYGVNLVTHERAGCVTVADGANNLLESWRCGAAGSWPGPAVQLNYANDGRWRKPVIRNNN